MRIRKYLSRKRFSMRQVVGLLMVVFLGVTVLAYAAVTIPNSFTPNTTAKASEVNANFQALVNGMAGAKTAGPSSTINFTSRYPAGSQLLTLSTTIPYLGKVIVTASGSVCIINHQTGSTDVIYLKISKTSAAFAGTGPFQEYRIDQTEPSQVSFSCVPFSISDVFDETSAGQVTYYLNGTTDYTASAFTGQIQQVSFYALYAPNVLP